MNTLRLFCSVPFIRSLLRKMFHPRAQEPVHITTLTARNYVGLGAGFDKNARYLRELETLGFGFVEIGTVTPKPQKGNPKPRLFRLKKDGALINRMGFNNDGAEKIALRLKSWRETTGDAYANFLIGGNIGKNKDTPNDDAWKDYEICFKELHPYVDYFVVNVSSPNTPGLRELQDKQSLKKIIRHLQMINNGKAHSKPIFLKIAPDLASSQVDDVIDLAFEIQLDGLVVSNTTISRDNLITSKEQINKIGNGGLSGLPLLEKNNKLLEYITIKTGGRIPVIASGGIFTAENANEKLRQGAVLVQVWTGFIYEGPSIARKIAENKTNGVRFKKEMVAV